MTEHRLEIPPEVAAVVRHLAPELKRSVKEALRALSRDLGAGEPLRQELKGLWKYRVRRYRVVYSIEAGRRLRIFAIGPRVDVYEKTAAALRAASTKPKGGTPGRT
jgi:mRNA-degrading endonuclease RelE of RelBE toxin-antitoxin system